MAEMLLEFQTPVTAHDGSTYRARAVGTEVPGGNWHGWIEFTPVGKGEPLRSPRETTQPNRTDVEYWATGLTPVYLEGALQRARNPVVRKRSQRAEPVFRAPAVDFGQDGSPPSTEAVLDPVSVYQKSEALLRQ